MKEFRNFYKDESISGDDIFYYVYGVLHAPDYQNRFTADLKKTLPRIPFAKDFRAFKDAGKRLAQLHLNFENGKEYPLNILVNGKPLLENILLRDDDYKITKMKWGKEKNKDDKTRIIYNAEITLSAIPEEALRYKVSGRPALQWLIDYYQVKSNKDSGIVNDPNDWMKEQNDSQWLIKHIKRITHISIESTKIIEALPSCLPQTTI